MTQWSIIFLATLPFTLIACETKVIRDNSVSARLARSTGVGRVYTRGADGKPIYVNPDKSNDGGLTPAAMKSMDLHAGGQQSGTTASLFTPINQGVKKKKKKGTADAPALVDKNGAGVPSILVQPTN